jgi:hypothetical protein
MPHYNAIHLIDPPAKLYSLHLCCTKTHSFVYYLNSVYAIENQCPLGILDQHLNLLWAAMVSVRLFLIDWHEAKVVLHTNSKKLSVVVNTGASRDSHHMTIARNIWLASAIAKFSLSAVLEEHVQLPKTFQIISKQQVKHVNNVHIDL